MSEREDVEGYVCPLCHGATVPDIDMADDESDWFAWCEPCGTAWFVGENP